MKQSFNAPPCRIPIDPAIFAAIGHRFIAKKKKIKNADAWVWGDVRGDQKPQTFCWPKSKRQLVRLFRLYKLSIALENIKQTGYEACKAVDNVGVTEAFWCDNTEPEIIIMVTQWWRDNLCDGNGDLNHGTENNCFKSLWSVVPERSNLPDSSSGISSRMWVRIPAVTLVSLSKTLNHNCFSPPRG